MDSYIGLIQLFAFNFIPSGWRLCDGSMVEIKEHAAVFALLGIAHGGDGRTHFALPMLVGKEPAPGLSYCICMEGIFPQRP